MITWLIGENDFEIREAVKDIEASFNGIPERVDGAELALSQLPDLLMGVSLFSDKRLVIISGISNNSILWEKIPEWLPRVNDDIHLVFVDTKPDKRTSSYKALKTASSVREFPNWSDRDFLKAEQWVIARAKDQNLNINKREAAHLVSRVGLNQWQLSQALEVLSLADEVTIDKINSVIPPNLHENIFNLLDAALRGDAGEVVGMIKTMSLQEDPYALFALMTSQALALAALLAAEGESGANPTKDFAIHPFVASKLAKYPKKLGRAKVSRIVEAFAKTDADMKRSKAEPWILIEHLLLEVAQAV